MNVSGPTLQKLPIPIRSSGSCGELNGADFRICKHMFALP